MTGIPKDAREIYTNEKGEPVAFGPKYSFGLTDLLRSVFYDANADRMRQLEERAATKPEPSVAICIDVDDSTWTQLVDALMPGQDWEQFRTRGEKPVARGVVPRKLVVDLVADVYPAAGEPPDGAFTAVFAGGGVMFVVARSVLS